MSERDRISRSTGKVNEAAASAAAGAILRAFGSEDTHANRKKLLAYGATTAGMSIVLTLLYMSTQG